MPDIISFRSFAGVNPEEEEDGLNLIVGNESFPMAVSRDEDIVSHLTEEAHRILGQAGAGELPLVPEEWSSTIWQRDLCNDTCYKSAYLFKNVLENNDHLSWMGYFALNDRLDEIPPVPQMFCGGFGLFTKNSVKKSAYRAMELLAQMGDRLVEKGNGSGRRVHGYFHGLRDGSGKDEVRQCEALDALACGSHRYCMCARISGAQYGGVGKIHICGDYL